MTHNPLKTRLSFLLTPDPFVADISRGDASATAGPGATTVSWVCRGSVVAVFTAISKGYTLATTPRRKIASLVYVRMCARPHTREPVSWCRGVVAPSYLFEKKEEKEDTDPRHCHDSRPQSVVAFGKYLKNSKIFGIYCHVA